MKTKKRKRKRLIHPQQYPRRAIFYIPLCGGLIHNNKNQPIHQPGLSNRDNLGPFILLSFPRQPRPGPKPKPMPSTSISCAPDSSNSGTTDCTGRGPLGEKAPRGRDTSRGQSSSGGSPIRLWGTGELWSRGSFSSTHLQGQSQLRSGAQKKEDSEWKVPFPMLVTYSKILPNWSASEFPQKRGLR